MTESDIERMISETCVNICDACSAFEAQLAQIKVREERRNSISLELIFSPSTNECQVHLVSDESRLFGEVK